MTWGSLLSLLTIQNYIVRIFLFHDHPSFPHWASWSNMFAKTLLLGYLSMQTTNPHDIIRLGKSLWTFHRLILQYQSIFSAHFYLDFDNFNELWRNGLRFHSREGEEELQFPGFERPHEEKYVSMQQNRLSIATSHHRRDNVTFYWGHHNVTSSLRIVIVTSYITLISTFICYVFFVQCQVILLPYRNTLAREQGEKIHTAVSSWIGFVQTRKYFVICMFRHYWIKIM